MREQLSTYYQKKTSPLGEAITCKTGLGLHFFYRLNILLFNQKILNQSFFR